MLPICVKQEKNTKIRITKRPKYICCCFKLENDIDKMPLVMLR